MRTGDIIQVYVVPPVMLMYFSRGIWQPAARRAASFVTSLISSIGTVIAQTIEANTRATKR